MKTTKIIRESKCCQSDILFIPAFIIDEDNAAYVCNKCNERCEINHVEVNTHIQVGPGVYRPIEIVK